MGLISLPVLNKISNSNYWSNIWESSNLFKKYFYLSIFLNKYFNLLFIDYTLSIINQIIVKNKFKKGYFINLNFKKKLLKNFFLGKVWILKYQTWYIITIRLFNTKVLKKKELDLKKKTKKWKNYYYSVNKNLNNKNLNLLNYKNQF